MPQWQRIWEESQILKGQVQWKCLTGFCFTPVSLTTIKSKFRSQYLYLYIFDSCAFGSNPCNYD